MFNRNNIPNPFQGARPNGGPRPPPRDPYQQSPAPPPKSSHESYDNAQMARRDYDTPMGGGYDQARGSSQYPSSPQRRPVPPPQGGGNSSGGGNYNPGSGQTWQLRPTKAPDNTYTFRNLVAVSPADIAFPRDGSRDVLIMLQGTYVVTAAPLDGFPPGSIGMSDAQRTWMGIALTDTVNAEMYDPFSQGGQAYLGSMDVEIGFASQKKKTDKPYDQDHLANEVIKICENQVFAPGQRFMLDLASIPVLLIVKTVQVIDLSSEKAWSAPTMTDPRSRGILTRHTQINFFRDGKTDINLKASNRRPAANSIITPDFKFEDMGIGGLDTEFSTIFRRAFASRIFPPGLVDKLGIQHVKGILLHGPPGTGKTLIARQIGKMLNAREPKVINGPEVLNKYVGQSEENIRKLFADAEKEYKEKGDESGLHIIIFDELDAVCKQRGSGAGGGTGVGDSVVNQLLSKLDGVDQLNNILLIGMTNRLDMIDDALLRPGRLEVHMEISLPDEHGRQQILKIHTQKMRDNSVMDTDVNIQELAHLTKNFSGAEIGGLVKSASSFAFNRHVKVGTMAGISDDIVNMKVKRADFINALEEVHPAFGVSEEELSSCIRGGIIPFNENTSSILQEARLFVNQVRQPNSTPIFSVLLYGPAGAGKTALAAKIAIDSEFPLIKLVSPEEMVGFTEQAKVQALNKAFMDAYKSEMSVIVLDNIERIVDWVPIGPRFSNTVLQAVMVLLRKQPPKSRRLLVIATSTERNVLQNLDILNSFDSDLPVNNVSSISELKEIMGESGAFTEPDMQRALDEITDRIGGEERLNVGVKKVLLSIETARQDTDMAARFAQLVVRAVIQSS